MPLNFVAKAAVTVALTAANMALTMTRKIEGPRLDDRKFSSGDYGAALPMVWGIRRLECPIFWAEDLKEVKRRRKTKGGKFNDYTYFGTWAVALAGHEIAGIRRIYFDTHLVLDLSGPGPVTVFDFSSETGGGKGGGKGSTSGESIVLSDYMALYLGTEDQEPDPRIQATVEAEFGEGSCPAYRGTAYIVFKDIPLEKLGNRIPQVSVEIVTNPAPYIPEETFGEIVVGGWQQAKFSNDFTRVMFMSNGDYEIWDVAARQPIVWGTLDEEPGSIGKTIGMYADGSFLFTDNSDMYLTTADGRGTTLFYTIGGGFGVFLEKTFVLADANGNEHWMVNKVTPGTGYYVNGVAYSGLASWFFADTYGDIWAVIYTGSAITTVTFQRVIDGGEGVGWPDTITITGLASSSSGSYATCVEGPDGPLFAFQRAGTLYVADPATATLVATGATAMPSSTQIEDIWANIPPGATSIWIQGREVSLLTGETLRTVTSYSNLTRVLYDPINHALIVEGVATSEQTWRYLDRVNDDGIALSQIAGDLADMVGIEDYDFSDLDQSVTGWSMTQGPASQGLEPLLDCYDADIRPHDFTIEGVKRHGVSGGTLLTERFVGEPRYTVSVRQAAELPRSVTINFADTDADQQPNNARADRPLDATGARGEKSLDMTPLALDVDEARQLADRYFRRLWNERWEASLSLTAQQLALEPADVRTLNLDGETITARARRVTIKADDTIETEWVHDSPTLALLDGASGASFDGRDESGIVVPLLSKGFALDIPLLADAHNDTNPLLYTAAAPYASGGWTGAVFYQETGGEYTDEFDSVSSNAQATWGYANDTLPDANPNLWDRLSEVNVTLQVGSLTGCTEADIDANPRLNMALIGDEIVNFTTATLESDGTYTLSGFKRGRRGTEWACATHGTRDVFLLLDTADDVEMGLSDVGADLSFKAVTNGRTESGAFPIDLTFTGASLKPYAPCALSAVKDASTGDWTFTWTRRTRVGGAWTGGSTIPLGETTEEYELDLSDGATTVTKTVTSPTYTWDVATQTSDTGAEVMEADLEWSVFQISASVDRGFEAVG